MKSRIPSIIGAIAVSALMLTGCSASEAPSGGSSEGGTSAESTKITFGNFGSGSASRFVMYAEELGYFADENLEIEFSSQTSTATLAQLLATGDLDLGYLSFQPAVDAREAGIDLRSVLVSQTLEPGMQTAWVNADSGIKSIEDLAATGGKIALPSLGGYNELLFQATFDELGLSTDKIEYIQVAPNDSMGGLERGDIVATGPTPPNRAAELGKGEASKLREIGDFAESSSLAGLYQGGIFANGKWADANPDALAAFERAVTRAVEEIEPQAELDLEKLVTLAKIPEESAPHFALETWVGAPDVKEIDRVLKLMTKYKMLDAGKVEANDFLLN